MSGGLSFFSVCFPSLFSIIDPIGVVPVYLALMAGEPRKEQMRTAARAVITATIVLIVFAATGASIFNFFGITIPAFKVAGGVLLATMALEMMRAKQSPVKSTPEETSDARAGDDLAVTPIGIPLISGPGAIATVIMWSTRAGGTQEKLALYASIGLVIAITPIGIPLISGPGAIATAIMWSSRATHASEKLALYASIGLTTGITLLALLFAARLVQLLGKTGINVITRIMGLILAATAAQFVLDGWKEAMVR